MERAVGPRIKAPLSHTCSRLVWDWKLGLVGIGVWVKVTIRSGSIRGGFLEKAEVGWGVGERNVRWEWV